MPIYKSPPVPSRPAPVKGRLSFRTPDEILAMEFDDSDIILGDRLLAETQGLSLCGAGGVGKSRLVLQLAVEQTIRALFLGSLTTHGKPRKWLFIQTENSDRQTKFQMGCLKRWVDKTYPGKWALVNEHIVFHTLENDNDLFLNVEHNRPELEAAIADHQPDIVVWDPLSNSTTGDLNKDVDMRAVVIAIFQISKRGNPKRAMVILHHSLTGKSGVAKAVGYDRNSFARNSKVLMALMRAQINVVPLKPENNEQLLVACGKANNGREFEPFAVELNTVPGTEGYMIYEPIADFDMVAWLEGVAGTKPKKAEPRCTPEMLVELLNGDGSGWKKKDLVKLAMDETGVAKTRAYEVVAEAGTQRLMTYRKSEKLFYLNLQEK